MHSPSLNPHGATDDSANSWVSLPLLVRCKAEERDGRLCRLESSLPPEKRSHPALPLGMVSYNVRVLPLVSVPENPEQLRKAVAGLPPLWGEHYKDLIRLTTAIGKSDSATVAKLVEAQTEEAHYAKEAEKNPRAWLATYFNSGLSGAQLVLWSDERAEGKLKPGIMCWQSRAIPFALLACNIAYAKGLRVCRRAKCSKVFPASREKQVYCSDRCRHAEEQARLRRKQTPPKRGKSSRRSKR